LKSAILPFCFFLFGVQKHLSVTSFLAAHPCGLSPIGRVPLHFVPLPSQYSVGQLANTPAQDTSVPNIGKIIPVISDRHRSIRYRAPDRHRIKSAGLENKIRLSGF